MECGFRVVSAYSKYFVQACVTLLRKVTTHPFWHHKALPTMNGIPLITAYWLTVFSLGMCASSVCSFNKTVTSFIT